MVQQEVKKEKKNLGRKVCRGGETWTLRTSSGAAPGEGPPFHFIYNTEDGDPTLQEDVGQNTYLISDL